MLLLLCQGVALPVMAQEDETEKAQHARPKALQRWERARMQQASVNKEEKVGPDSLTIDSISRMNKANFDALNASGPDSLTIDSISRMNKANFEALEAPVDTANLLDGQPFINNKEKGKRKKKMQTEKEHKVFIPDPAKATWLAVIFPGGGQIYNRKYWKLPIVYGGFVGCAYALSWNGQMYSDYSQAYLDIMDDNPNTDSYLDLLPPGYNVDANIDYLKKVIKRKKDSYRRYRDLSIFCFIGVYIVSIIDAYVDAELASFDIGRDLTLKMEPTIINDRKRLEQGNSYGVQCSIRF